MRLPIPPPGHLSKPTIIASFFSLFSVSFCLGQKILAEAAATVASAKPMRAMRTAFARTTVVVRATKKPLMTQRLRCVSSDVFQSVIGAQEGTRTPTMLLAST